MKLYELKHRDVEFISKIKSKETFIRYYGSRNCKYLTLKSYNDIINEFDEEYLCVNDIELLKNVQNQEVLCFIDKTEAFIWFDDNTPIPLECFVENK